MIFEDSLIPWIGKTGKMLGFIMNKTFKDENINLTREQFIVLKLLAIDDGKPQHDLAFITERNKTSLSRLISNMEKNNLIYRTSTKKDKRIKKVSITPFGKEIAAIATPIVKKAIETFQEGISEAEIQHAITTIKKIQHNISKVHSFKLCDKL